MESEYYLAAKTGNHRICFFTSCANDEKSVTPWYVADFTKIRAISKFTCAMAVSFSPLDNIIISMLWELLHRNVIVSHNSVSILKARQTLWTNMNMYMIFIL